MLLSYVVLDYNFEKVIWSILNLHVLVQYFINRYIFSSIKETNWLISKQMWVLLFDVFNRCSVVKKWIGKGMSNIYYWENWMFSKLVGKEKFFGKKIWRNRLALKSKKVQGIFGETFWHYCLQLSFIYKTVTQISFNLFCLGVS